MKAIIYDKYGPPDVLRIANLDQPVPASDELLIRVQAVEATKADCELRAFRFSVKWFWLPLRLAVGIFSPRRKVLGGYFAGEVVAVGSEVDGYDVGDSVYGSSGLRMGAYGEYLTLPTTATIAAKPANMSYAEAAAVPLGGLNALHFMRLADLRHGEKILINGAGGSIGAHAVQIAKSSGAYVAAVDSGAKEGFLLDLGVDHFIDYTREDFSKQGRSYDVVFDMVPGSSYAACMKVLKNRGRYYSGNPRLLTMLRAFCTNRLTDKTARFAFAAETKEELETLTALIESEHIRSIVDRTLPLEQASVAHELVETEQRLGAIVLELA